jgi:hypothetical protein
MVATTGFIEQKSQRMVPERLPENAAIAPHLGRASGHKHLQAAYPL